MNVLTVINSLAPGGTEQSTVLLAAELRRLGVSTEVVTLKGAEHDLSDAARAAGTPVARLSSSGFFGKMRELRRMIRQRRPDVVHTALFDADQLGRLAAWGTGVPVISSFVNTPYDSARLLDPNVRRSKLLVVRMIDACTGLLMVTKFHAVSEGVKRANGAALRIRLSKIVVAERGREVSVLGMRTSERTLAVRSALNIAQGAFVVLNLGRQEHQKGQLDLLAAVKVLVQSHPNVVVLIAGKTGSATTALDDVLHNDVELRRHVRLLGHRDDVGDLLAAADVLVISSHFEGTAGVALEAMAMATPIVSTDLTGLVGVLEHERDSLLVTRHDPGAMAAAIGRLIDDPRLSERLATAAASGFRERFTLDAAAKRMRDLYASVVERPAPVP